MNFPDIGLQAPRILLPRPGIDLHKWSVIACDQYTSQPAYWNGVSRFVGDLPSTLKLILPEYALDAPDRYERISTIHNTMADYLNQGILVPQPAGFMLVHREAPGGVCRTGLIAALDLEQYDFSKNSRSLIRATEGTILDRLPPRVAIRTHAPLEVPHILVLIDDPGRTVIEPLSGCRNTPAYDTELMMGGGRVRGWSIQDHETVRSVAARIRALALPASYTEKYGTLDQGIMLYAVGDGNHSLAAAKVCWENIKSALPEKDSAGHPARYAMVELVNLYDDGIEFEPIHRVAFAADPEALLGEACKAYFSRRGSSCAVRKCETVEEVYAAVGAYASEGAHCIGFVAEKSRGVLTVYNPVDAMPVGTLQGFLDSCLPAGARLDYIHGSDAVVELGAAQGNAGFLLPGMSKHDVFKAIVRGGVLPRKTFSMGAADEKRFYMECRKILP